MTAPAPLRDEFLDLMYDLAEGRLSSEAAARLEALLEGNSVRQHQYVSFMLIVGGLHRIRSVAEAGSEKWEAGIPSDEFRIPNSNLPEPLPIIAASSFPPLPSSLYSLGGLMFSYMMSAVILGVAMLGAWAYTISHDSRPIAENQLHPVPSPAETIGRITGMTECVWADPDTETFLGASVRLSRKVALMSGLIEITYDSGAKVLLQGPCTYEVKSASSGYLNIGKLTVRICNRSKAIGNRSAGSDSSFLSPVASNRLPLFSIQTPTAVVTDLGTEFGVSVDNAGESNVHVFSGHVELAQRTKSGESANPQRLHSGQMARVGRAGIQPLHRSGLKPMAAMQEQLRPLGFVQDFRHGVKGMVLQGKAQLKGEAATGYVTRLRLTDNNNKQTGAAWRAIKQSAAAGFIAEFQFQFSFPACSGADGMAFVIQNTSQGTNLLVGHRGAADHALNVCLDSFQNTDEGDPGNASIVVRAGGKVLARVDLKKRFGIDDLSDSMVHTVRIRYAPGRLDIDFDGSAALANLPVDLTALDGGSAVDADGKAWIGFGARTGDATENHDVLVWRFLSKEKP
jgi:hypothetical protein